MKKEEKLNMTPEEIKYERKMFMRQTVLPLIIIVVNFSLAMLILYWSHTWGRINYQSNSNFSDGRITVSDEGKWFLMDENGEKRSEGYSAMSTSRYDMIAVRNDEGKWGYINKYGEEVIECIYEEAGHFGRGGLSRVKKDGKYLYINEEGQKQFDKEFISAEDFGEHNIVRIKTENGIGLMNNLGDYVIEPGEYADIGEVSLENGYVAVKGANGLWGYVDSQGISIIGCRYTKAFPFSYGCAMVTNEEGLFGFVTKDGGEIVPCMYTNARDFTVAQYAAVCNEEGKWGYIDIYGKEKVPCRFKDCLDFTGDESAAVCNEEGKWGYIKNNGTYIIEPKFKRANPFSDISNIAAVQKEDGKWIYISRKEKQVIKEEFDYATSFDTNSIVTVGVKTDGKMQYAVIDEDGEIIVDYGKYDEITVYANNEVVAKKGDRYSFISEKGNVIAEGISDFKPAGGVVIRK